MSTAGMLPPMFALLEALILIEPDLYGPFWALICLGTCGSEEFVKMTPILFFLLQSEKIKSETHSSKEKKNSEIHVGSQALVLKVSLRMG